MQSSGVSARKLAVVMAKEPQPGKVKTRLTPPLTPQEAVDLYSCFLQDRFSEAAALTEAEVAVAYTPARAIKFFADRCPQRFGLFAQQGRTLGERLLHIFRKSLSAGYVAVSVTGSDLPDLPNRMLRESFEHLLEQSADLVLGPTPDGGYYLMAAKKAYPELFVEIPWSTGKVLAATLQKARRLGLKTHLLPAWNDLDTFQDLADYHHAFASRNAEGEAAGRITYAFLKRFMTHPYPAKVPTSPPPPAGARPPE